MRCPRLDELPSPPPGKTGWPWTEESPQLPDTMPDGSRWPRISIVTPSLNQGRFIEETIRSVLLQGYPDLEYIIIDGGSTDNTIEIIKKYERWITYWVSEPDKGQAHAINKGFKRVTGQIVAWLNSDDIYCKNIFKNVVKNIIFLKKDIIYSDVIIINDKSKLVRIDKATPFKKDELLKYWKKNYYIPQPTVFFRKSVIDDFILNENMHYAFDWDFWIRISKKYKFNYVDQILAKYRLYDTSKTGSGFLKFIKEQEKAIFSYYRDEIDITFIEIFFNSKLYQLEYYLHNILRIKILNILSKIISERKLDKIRNLKRFYLK